MRAKFVTVDVITQVFGSNPGPHTLVRDRNTLFNPKFISKYGTQSPIIGHEFDSTYYELDNATKTEPDKYYVYLKLKSSEFIPKDQIKEIALPTKSGVTYSWSIVGQLGIVSFTSATNGASVSIKGDSFGTTQIKVTISGCGGIPPKEQIIEIIVPSVTISGTYTTSSSSNHILGNGNQVPTGNISTYLTQSPPVTNYVWQRYQGTLSFWAHTNQMHFTMQSGNYVSFKIYARNARNDTLAVRNVTYYNYGTFSLYPNPSSSTISIKSEYKGIMDMEIIPLNTTSKILKFKVSSDEKAEIKELPRGEYLIVVRIGDDVVLESRLLKNE